MIPALRTTPHFGRDGLNLRPFEHFAMGSSIGPSWEGAFYGAGSDLKFSPQRARGDIGRYREMSANGVFRPTCKLQHDGKLFIGGRIIVDGNTSIAALFVAEASDGWVWRRLALGFETRINGVYRSVAGIAAYGSTVVALISTGERSVSTDNGESFTGHGSIGFTGSSTTGIATCIAASAAGFVAGGVSGQLFECSNPASAWTARNSQFGTTAIAAIIAASVFIIVGNAKISTAALNNLATWTARTVPGGVSLDTLMARPGRVFAGGINSWLTTTDGVTWTAPSNKPWGAESSRPRGGYYDGGRWVVHYGSGSVAESSDETIWTDVPSNGLPEQTMAVSAYVS